MAAKQAKKPTKKSKARPISTMTKDMLVAELWRAKKTIARLEREHKEQIERLERNHELDCDTNYTYKWNDDYR